MPEANDIPPVPLAFLIPTFAIAIAIGAVVAWLGMTGQIGAGIP
ncbi:MAG TPA: hypothetical protein VMG81_00920 [Thermoplasmata archaeon]|nr:hypothetical protein [Thermoplasmata archaeon]